MRVFKLVNFEVQKPEFFNFKLNSGDGMGLIKPYSMPLRHFSNKYFA